MIRELVRLIAFLLLLCLLAGFALISCGTSKTDDQDGPITIVATIFPVYDWIRNILGNNPSSIELIFLLDSGSDLHNFQPSVRDMLHISTCDLFVYVGGESDEWVPNALKQASNKLIRAINLLEILGDRVKEEEYVDGMETETDDGEKSPDEHVWLSLQNAAFYTDYLCSAISELDPGNQTLYEHNRDLYKEKLGTLNQKYRDMVDHSEQKTILFGDRFPFRYMVEDYGLTYYAAFAGCSAESEASFATIANLAAKVDEFGLKAVCKIEGTRHQIAETIVQSTIMKDQKILVFDSMQSVTAKNVEDGLTYLGVMEKNYTVLQDALR